nr:MAG TPA: hypothetical protein [Caudoviricetes sp.]
MYFIVFNSNIYRLVFYHIYLIYIYHIINIFYYYHKICYYKLYIKKWGFCYEL